EEVVSNEDWDYLKSLWYDLKGTGTYATEVKTYLTDKGYTLTDTYTSTFSTLPNTYDIHNTSRSSVSQYIVNTYDGLVQYDQENEMQPSLATDWEVSDDGLTYTFHIREGVEWVDSQARSTGYTVTADDWVAGMQHMIDTQSGLGDLLDGIVEGVHEYIYGEITDFAEVGVEATDDLTLVYHLVSPCTYFLSMLTYNDFAPLCRGYYQEQGGKFGSEYSADDAEYVYGTTFENIAYCGPFLITQMTEQTKIAFEQNPTYWNLDGTVPTLQPNLTAVTFIYNDGSDPQKYVDDFVAGTTSALTCTDERMALLLTSQGQDFIDENVHLGDTGSTSYQIFLNLFRQSFVNFNDGVGMASSQTEEDAVRTNAAMNNIHFRQAVTSCVDRETYNEQSVGEAAKLVSVRNTYTPGDFVSLEEDITVDINGTATDFAAGTYYGEIMQAQLDADGSHVKAWDPETSTSDGFDGWYDAEYAASELETAIAELAEDGYVIDEENPIYLDIPTYSSSTMYLNRAQVLKSSVEEALGGKVIVNVVGSEDIYDWYYSCYLTDYGYDNNYDLNDFTGWGPDYGDPSTYLGTMLPDYSGYVTKSLGIF
ncbi:MAG: ABC transporter substrate-binding protein, partial [Lachnospiraceae bacterium]|nr:ABC transporter substrate-binding protein [Lachnospiraceae bacterium]